MRRKPIGDRGQVHPGNLSQATSSSNFYPTPLRLIWFEQRLLCKLILWMLSLASLFISIGVVFADGRAVLSLLSWIVGAFLLIPALLLMSLMVLYIRNTKEAFKNGLLTGGIVDKSTRSVIHIAPLSKRTGPEGIIYGIRRSEYQAFPYRTLGKSGRIACASFFSGETRNPPSWESFTPIPIAFGTGDIRKIRACLDVVERGPEDRISCLEILERFLEKHAVPADFEDLYVCNSDGELLETRVIKKKRRKTPPPMPT